MRKIIFFLALLTTTALMAQTSKNTFHVNYIKTHNHGDSANKRLSNSYCHLYITDSTSYCVAILDKTKPPANIPNVILMPSPDSSEIVFKNTYQDYLVFQSTNAFVKGWFTDTLNLMLWNIMEETKQVDSFTCTKAITNFRGSQYIAWFCQDIPLPHGPSKFGGLPGLIVELYDTNELNHYRLQTIAAYNGNLPTYKNKYPAFAEYKKKAKEKFELLKEMLRTQQGQENCLTCGDNGTTTITITDWENVFN